MLICSGRVVGGQRGIIERQSSLAQAATLLPWGDAAAGRDAAAAAAATAEAAEAGVRKCGFLCPRI